MRFVRLHPLAVLHQLLHPACKTNPCVQSSSLSAVVFVSLPDLVYVSSSPFGGFVVTFVGKGTRFGLVHPLLPPRSSSSRVAFNDEPGPHAQARLLQSLSILAL
jgi:hypothetical protein